MKACIVGAGAIGGLLGAAGLRLLNEVILQGAEKGGRVPLVKDIFVLRSSVAIVPAGPAVRGIALYQLRLFTN
jgi:hypothetical protein